MVSFTHENESKLKAVFVCYLSLENNYFICADCVTFVTYTGYVNPSTIITYLDFSILCNVSNKRPMGQIAHMRKKNFLATNKLAQNYDYTKRGVFKGKK